MRPKASILILVNFALLMVFGFRHPSLSRRALCQALAFTY
jgi:hypothetical protein